MYARQSRNDSEMTITRQAQAAPESWARFLCYDRTTCRERGCPLGDQIVKGDPV
jgi:hypothetical protein